METVPSLCASGTLGVAAVGLALGHPQHSVAARPTSKKRRMPSRTSLRDSRSLQDIPTTPARPPQPASAPTSRLRKRASVGRPLTSSGNMRGGIRTLGSTPETKLNHGSENGVGGHPPFQASEQPLGHGPFSFEFQGAENTPPSWLRRMSTLSSLKNGSPDPTPRPESSSLSYSNGSTAPILPNFAESSPSVPSRNKLVKRSSSQRLLQGSKALHSTLRRPATSHQRSATLQQHYQQDEDHPQPSFTAPSTRPPRNTGSEQPFDGDSQIWLPSFKTQSRERSKEGTFRKRGVHASANRNDSIKTILPDMTEVTTLLMATSLSSGTSDEEPNGRTSNVSRLSRPFTPIGLDTYTSPKTGFTDHEVLDISETKPRTSFSLSEIFPSPSPTTWKIPRTGSLRRTKPFVRDTGGRRVVSAPQPGDFQHATQSPQNQKNIGKGSHVQGSAENQLGNSGVQANPSAVQQRGSSSPLLPLHRLSVFEVDLPGQIPSYPATPQLENHAALPRERFPPSSQLTSSPLGPVNSNTRPYRISSAPSEPGSTLLGSDNDNSRLMSGDEDDLDSRSETVYDSTRTGATGSSHSGIRRPPIGTIFDESPPPELPSKRKLIDLQDLVHNDDSFFKAAQDNRKGERDLATPVRTIIPGGKSDDLNPMRDVGENLEPPGAPSSSSPVVAELSNPPQPSRSSDADQDDELWSFEQAEISHAEAVHIRNVSLSGSSNPLAATPLSREDSSRRRSPPTIIGSDKSSKPNLFEWSEQSFVEKDSSQGGSPRPKTVHGRQGKDSRGSHVNGRRGPSALHLRSQSVPVQKDMTNRRSQNNPSHLDAWRLGHNGPSEDWDGDFDFEEAPRVSKQHPSSDEPIRPSFSSGMLVPRNILERQASVHGQFGQVKELALLVEDLKRLQQQAAGQGIIQGQSAELWKEAEGIINLATLDDEEQEIFPPRSPHSPSFDFDNFDEDSPSTRNRQRPGPSPPREERVGAPDVSGMAQRLSQPSQEGTRLETPPRPTTRPRNDSSAKAKSVLETIHQQRSHYDASLLDAPFAQKKLPFDTTSLKDLVIRAGVVTRALKEIVRRAENGPETPVPRPETPRDPPYISQMFHEPSPSRRLSKSPRVTQSPKSPKSPRSPKSPKSQRSETFIGGTIAGNDNEINGPMKMMAVV